MKKTMLLLLMMLHHQAGLAGETIGIAVASNFAGAMQALLEEFEPLCVCTVNVSYGSSGRFYAQLRRGAPYDVFFSADQATLDALSKADLIVESSRLTYAVGALVLWSPNVHRESPQQRLKTGQFRHLAMANPKLAPYGLAASQVLNTLSISDGAKEKSVRGENIGQTYQFLHSGSADLGFIALAQWLNPARKPRGHIWAVPSHLHQPIKQDAALLKRYTGIQGQQLLNFVASQRGQEIIRRYGYR